MLTGRMPVEMFPEVTECQSSEDTYFTEHIKYKIFPNTFLVDGNTNKPATSLTRFEPKMETSQPINSGILVNDPKCKITCGNILKTKNYILATYVGRLPLTFYADKTKYGEHFKLTIHGNDLDKRTFCKEDDLTYNTLSRHKNTFYSGGY